MARLYVGTYHKYNSGSIAGAWIDLEKCATYADFLAECRKAHKDEADPEFMIQDHEELPDGLACGEWIGESDFNDIKAAMAEEESGEEAPAPAPFRVIDYSEKAIAVVGDTKSLAAKFKALGGRFNPRLSCGAGWIFSKRQEAAVSALLGAHAEKKAEGETQKAEGPDYSAAVEEYLATIQDEGDRKYYRRNIAAVVKFPEGFFVISKPSIENRFCFHDEGPDYELYKHLNADEKAMAEYFVNENLQKVEGGADVLDPSVPAFVYALNYRGRAEVGYTSRDRYYNAEKARDLTPEERQAVAEATRYVRQGFEKRLHAYLKRYGTAKIHTWSYWADA